MKKFLITLFILISTQSLASEVKMNFTKDAFENAQKSGKTVVVNSWNKFCMTCIKQEKIIKKALTKIFGITKFTKATRAKNRGL